MTTLRKRFELARDRAAELNKIPADERTAEQAQELADQLDRAESLKADLDAEQAREDRLDALGEVSRGVALPGVLEVTAELPELSVGEYLVAAAAYVNGGSVDEFLDRAGRYHDRATTDVAGIIPEPIIGPIIDIYDDRRRIWNSFTARTMPSEGKTFDRPRVTAHVAVGEQSTEGATLDTNRMTVVSDPVTKRTFGGMLEIPRQEIDWTSPAALGLVVNDFVKVYNRTTELAAVTHLVGLATATSPYSDTTTTTVVNSYVNGALAVSNTLDDDVPLTIWLDTATAAGHTRPVGSTDRSEWSVIEEALMAMDNQFNVVVSRRLPAGTRIIGAGELVEAYEQRHGLLSLAKPTNLSTDLAYSGYAAFHGIADGFVSVEV